MAAINPEFPLSERLRFAASYALGVFVLSWMHVRRPRLRTFLYALAYAALKIVRRRSMLPDPFRLSRVETVDGSYALRPRTADLATVLPGYERRDRIELRKVVHARLDAGKSVLFVDVGAALGIYSVSLARSRRGRNLRVVAIEANSEAAALMTANARENAVSEMITVVNAVVWKERGVAFAPRVNPRVPTSGAFEPTVEVSGIVSETLDQIVLPHLGTADLLVMKLDVEGAEAAAISGASAVLSTVQDALVLVEDFEDQGGVKCLRSIGATFVKKLTPYNSWWALARAR